MTERPYFTHRALGARPGRSVRRRLLVRVGLAAGIVAGATVAMVPLATPSSATDGWSAPVSIDPGGSFQNIGGRSVSCAPGSSFCAAVDNNGNAFTYDGSTWSAPSDVDPAAGETTYSISCASTTLCEDADWHGSAVTYDGSSWSAPVGVPFDPFTFPPLFSVSCAPESTFCTAGDQDGYAHYYSGGIWTTLTPAVDAQFVSCSSSDFCAAVDGNGDATTFDGMSWSSPVTIDDAFGLGMVSCTSSTFCVAADSSNNAFIYDGTSWSAPEVVDSGFGLTSVSCISPSFCVAVDGNGDAITYDGTSWSAPTNIDPDAGLSSVSCASVDFCVALDSLGNALVYGPLPMDVATTSLPVGTVGKTYSSTLAAANGVAPYAWAITGGGLPGGLTLDPTTGVISGTPTTDGTSSFTVEATDSSTPTAQTATASLSLTIGVGLTAPSIPTGTVGHSYSVTLSAQGGNPPYTWKLARGSAKLPKGLKLNKHTGVISGTPKRTGTSTFTVEVLDKKVKTRGQPSTQNTATIVVSITIS